MFDQILFFWCQKDSGGVDTHTINLLKYWPGNEKFILLVNRDNKGFQHIKNQLREIKNVEVRYINNQFRSSSRFLKALKYIFFPFYIFLLVLKSILEIRKHNFSRIIVQNGGYPGSYKSLSVVIASKVLNKEKIVMIVHHSAIHGNLFRPPFWNFLDLLVMKSASDLVAVSHATRNSLIQRGWDTFFYPIRVIHNGFEFNNDKLNFEQSNFSLRENFNIDEDSIILLILGRIERYKGHEDLIIGLSGLTTEEQEKISTVFVGSYERKEQIRLIKLSKNLGVKNIFFTGFIDEKIDSLMSQSDILCMLTKDFEAFGLTIGEAMTLGIPVLATKVGAIEELFDDSIASLIRPESPVEISNFIHSFLNSRSEYDLKAKRAKIAVQKYSAEKTAQNFHRLVCIE